MRRKNKEIQNRSIIEEILHNTLICRMGIITDDVPYIVPVNYGYKDGCIYIHSAPEGRKIDLLRLNNKVSFEIEYDHEIMDEGDSCDCTTKYRSLMGVGFVDILTDYNDKIHGLDILMKQHGRDQNSYKKKLVDNMVILKLNIHEVTGKQSGKWD